MRALQYVQVGSISRAIRNGLNWHPLPCEGLRDALHVGPGACRGVAVRQHGRWKRVGRQQTLAQHRRHSSLRRLRTRALSFGNVCKSFDRGTVMDKYGKATLNWVCVPRLGRSRLPARRRARHARYGGDGAAGGVPLPRPAADPSPRRSRTDPSPPSPPLLPAPTGCRRHPRTDGTPSGRCGWGGRIAPRRRGARPVAAAAARRVPAAAAPPHAVHKRQGGGTRSRRGAPYPLPPPVPPRPPLPVAPTPYSPTPASSPRPPHGHCPFPTPPLTPYRR